MRLLGRTCLCLMLASTATLAARPVLAAHSGYEHRSRHARNHHARRHHVSHQHGRVRAASRRYGAAPGYGYGASYDGQPTCYLADGTPYDPDIIGGVNHVGDGGPAVNFGGFNPCGY